MGAMRYNNLNVMPGLDPGIHDESRRIQDFSKDAYPAQLIGLPGPSYRLKVHKILAKWFCHQLFVLRAREF